MASLNKRKEFFSSCLHKEKLLLASPKRPRASPKLLRTHTDARFAFSPHPCARVVPTHLESASTYPGRPRCGTKLLQQWHLWSNPIMGEWPADQAARIRVLAEFIVHVPFDQRKVDGGEESVRE